MTNQQTIDKLQQMRLVAMADGLLAQTRNPEVHTLSFEERLGLLVDQEWTYRQNRRLARRLRDAKLRLAACMEDIDYQHPRGLERPLLRSLAHCQWVPAHQNILIEGPAGVGKTFLACALANAALRRGFTARYYRLARLFTDLAIARADGSYPRLAAQLARTHVLVLDDWGIAPMTAPEARELLDIIDERYQAQSTIVASQLPVDHWHATIADPSVADAILDRLIHHSHKLVLKGESMRKITKHPKQIDQSES